MKLKIIVGLGNPSVGYSKTRHNIGFRVIDTIRRSIGIKKKSKTKLYNIYYGDDLILVKPLTFMNRSGLALKALCDKYSGLLTLDGLLIILDDVALPFGKIRIRKRGFSGGHNGLDSIINELSTDNIARLRIGVGANNSDESLEQFVLKEFTKEEEIFLPKVIDLSINAITCWSNYGIDVAMNKYNGTESIGNTGPEA